MTTRVCATCKDADAKGAAKLVEAGFVRCKHLPAWEWLAGHKPCRFEPVRWVAKT